MNGTEFAMTLSALRKNLKFLIGESGPEHTKRLFSLAEQLQAGTITWKQIQDEEAERARRGMLQPRRGREELARQDTERRAARDARWEAWHRQFERPAQKPMSVREELEHPKQTKLKRAKAKYTK